LRIAPHNIEVILEHAEGPQAIVATLIPHASRSEDSKTTLKAFRRTIETFADLPDIIAAAGALIGIRGYGSNLEADTCGRGRCQVSGIP
jgi:hypothetical protein